MEYKYSTLTSYEFLASGNIIYAEPGCPNFPVKLANEIFNRCLEHLDDKENITLYDPCCGIGYTLLTVSLLNYHTIHKVIGSDIDDSFLAKARQNFSLLTKEGIGEREAELKSLWEKYGKQSHYNALSDIHKFYDLIAKRDHSIETDLFQRDILSEYGKSSKIFRANVVLTDIPYGNLVGWSRYGGIDRLLDNIIDHLRADSIIAIISDKAQKRTNNKYSRVEKFNAGKRRVELLRLKRTV